ncbi:stabilin-1 [Xenentodon cancila]
MRRQPAGNAVALQGTPSLFREPCQTAGNAISLQGTPSSCRERRRPAGNAVALQGTPSLCKQPRRPAGNAAALQGTPSPFRERRRPSGNAVVLQGTPSPCRERRRPAGNAVVLQGTPPPCRERRRPAGNAVVRQGTPSSCRQRRRPAGNAVVLQGTPSSCSPSCTAAPGRCDVQKRLDLHTDCTSCAAVITASCPPSFTKTRTTNCSYVVQIGSRQLELQGCRHVCVRSFMQPQCCPGHWGPLCLPCPSWSGKFCNFNGVCVDGDVGNGTCICADGFTGFACQECQNPNAYGSGCNKECDCVNGVCNNGPDGDGQCLCQPPYTGKRCDQVSSRCSSCGPYSYCKGDRDDVECECLPGYRRMVQDKCAIVCSQRDCDVNAQCSLQGSKIKCACKPDYEGDGKICIPRNPCLQDNGGCPINSTVCVFKGPNKSSCECMSGMSPVDGGPESGCQLLSACTPDTCDSSAICQTELDGNPRCVCEEGQIGDGWRCYGNLMERLVELDTSGRQRENLTGAIDLFEKGCSQLLSGSGPFTAFFPVLKAPLTGVNEELVCKNHLILGQHLHTDIEDRDFTVYGGAKLRGKRNKRFILMDNPSRLYTIVQSDLPASNGIIHIIDKPITNTPSDRLLRDEQFADKTIGEILTLDDKYNRFLSLVDNCGSPPPLRGPGPFTVFVPTNKAVDRARDGSILYMLHDAKHKLQELLRHHIFFQAVLTVDELSTLPYIRTMANQLISITASDDGEIHLGSKAVPLVSTNIMASNGVIHMIDGLLYPPSILPILPHRCDVTESKITVTPCVHCNYLHEVLCPEGSVEMESHQAGCNYVLPAFGRSYNKGCAKYCNTTRQVAECCEGFYGPDCKPCIGGFQHPCYDRGTCFDGIHGNGSCSCHSNFTGVACHICSDPSKHGPNCDEECRCVHGVCDNRPGSGGMCRRGLCLEGYSGEFCDKKAMVCNSDGLLQHCHIHAYCTQTGLETKASNKMLKPRQLTPVHLEKQQLHSKLFPSELLTLSLRERPTTLRRKLFLATCIHDLVLLTLSGRDLEYHVSANRSRWPFKDLRQQAVISSRLGFNLTVTHGNNETWKKVNQRLLLEWDIPAVNGIIHVIEAPLLAPPSPITNEASRSHSHSSGAVSTILVLLLACVLAAVGYYIFKHKKDAFRFRLFRNEDDDAATSRAKHTLVSIPNPLYFSSRAFAQTVGVESTSRSETFIKMNLHKKLWWQMERRTVAPPPCTVAPPPCTVAPLPRTVAPPRQTMLSAVLL